jgi:deazaflavin-dependent oxidoreductase (nitroreductase family)
VAAVLKHVDPTRPAGAFSRLSARLANTRFGRFFSRNVVWKVDPWLMRVSGGRLGFGLGIPTALLETSGARSGEPRANGVIYFHDGDRVTIVASKMGLPENPAWFHNLRAHPEVVFAGVPMRAEIVADEAEHKRLWALADNVFAPYATYRGEAASAGREIPIVQLRPTVVHEA